MILALDINIQTYLLAYLLSYLVTRSRLFFALGVLGGTGTYSVPLRASTPSHVWGFQAPEIEGGQGRRGPHV